jgi:hypothetical protein
MPTKKTIAVPKVTDAVSALDGISMMALDTDPDETLGGVLYNLRGQGNEILAVAPTTFRGRPGYLIVTRRATS